MAQSLLWIRDKPCSSVLRGKVPWGSHWLTTNKQSWKHDSTWSHLTHSLERFERLAVGVVKANKGLSIIWNFSMPVSPMQHLNFGTETILLSTSYFEECESCFVTWKKSAKLIRSSSPTITLAKWNRTAQNLKMYYLNAEMSDKRICR